MAKTGFTIVVGRKAEAPLLGVGIEGMEAGSEVEGVNVKVEIEVDIEVAIVTLGPTGGG